MLSRGYKKTVQLQKILASRVNLKWVERKVCAIAGIDAAYKDGKIIGAFAVLSFPELRLVEKRAVAGEIGFPYLPSFLALRELPVFLQVFKLLENVPDLVIVDGNGIAHPRKLGLASHLGIILNIPTIGCAKSPFYPVSDPPFKRGSYRLMKNERGEVVGAALRTRDGVKPVYVSPGHLIDLEKSIEFVLKSSIYRLPEPLRQAHQIASRFKF